MVKCPFAVWGEHIYILLFCLGWGGLITAISVFYAVVAIKRETRHYSRVSSMPWMLRSPCVCGRRTSSKANSNNLWLLLHSLWYSHGCALTPLEHPMSIYKRKRKKYISLCESYDYIIEILKVIGHPRIGQMTWDSIRYVVTRNSRLWLCYML